MTAHKFQKLQLSGFQSVVLQTVGGEVRDQFQGLHNAKHPQQMKNGNKEARGTLETQTWGPAGKNREKGKPWKMVHTGVWPLTKPERTFTDSKNFGKHHRKGRKARI